MDNKYEDRIVVFIDILGFGDRVNEIEQNGDWEDVVGFLKHFQELATSNELDKYKFFTTHVKRWEIGFDFKLEEKIDIEIFSDSVIISIDFEEDNFHEAFSSIMLKLSLMGLDLLIHDIYIRGGISLGKMYHGKNHMIFGKGLNDAVQLEKIANFPRIILTREIMKKLTPYKSEWPYYRLIWEFHDGYTGFNQFNLLRAEITRDFQREEEKAEIIKLGWNVCRSLISALDKSKGDSHVFEKYKWLKEEFLGCIRMSPLDSVYIKEPSVSSSVGLFYKDVNKELFEGEGDKA